MSTGPENVNDFLVWKCLVWSRRGHDARVMERRGSRKSGVIVHSEFHLHYPSTHCTVLCIACNLDKSGESRTLAGTGFQGGEGGVDGLDSCFQTMHVLYCIVL
jgi:hypothetical protein